MAEDAVHALDTDEGEVERDADGEGQIEIVRRMGMPMAMAVTVGIMDMTVRSMRMCHSGNHDLIASSMPTPDMAAQESAPSEYAQCSADGQARSAVAREALKRAFNAAP
jgi:hypothetical protein